MTNQNIQFRAKITADGNNADEKWISFIGTAPTLDRDGEVIDTASLRVPVRPTGFKHASDLTENDVVDLPFLIDHSWSVEKQIGSVRSLFINENGELQGVAGLANVDEAMRVHELAKKDHLGNSISGTFDYSSGYVVDGVIHDAELLEFSVVFKGSNRDARVLAVSKQAQTEGKSMDDTKTPIVDDADAVVIPDDVEIVDEVVDKIADEVVAEVEQPVEQPVVDAVEKIIAPIKEQPVETVVEKETIVSEINEIASKQVVAELPTQEIVAKRNVKRNEKAIRELYVKQFMAFNAGDSQTLGKLNLQAMELDGVDTKIVTPTEGSALYQSEIVSGDILAAYQVVGGVGALVNKIDIMGATQWKTVVEASGSGFSPVGVTEVKPEDEPVWTSVVVLPKEHAMIVAWYDTIARQTPIAVYQQIVRYVAGQYARLEDKIILSFAGVTSNGGDVFAPTGLVPILDGTAQEYNFSNSYSANAIMKAFGTAFGLIKSDRQLSIVCNRATWGKLAVTRDTTGVPVFQTVGSQVTVGALGTFNVVISTEIVNDEIVMGAFSEYDLVTRGGLETLFSQHATVGSVNLFTQDASALRACVEIAGKPERVSSFALLTAVATTS